MIDATAALLAEVFPGSRISRADYLEWLYQASPFGAVVETNLDDEQGRAGHYAVVPIDLTRDGAPLRGALSLNTAVHERARGGGTFVALASATYEAARARGIEAVVGVANAASTPGFLRRLQFELVTPLPTQVLLPVPGRRLGVRSTWASPAVFGSGGVADGLETLLSTPARGLARAWTPETLRWRLEAPGSRYALHRSADALAVSTADARHGVAVALILKVFATRPLDAAARRALVRAVCRTHRAPVALHVGCNDRAAFAGVPLPERLRESPLNFIYRALGTGSPRPERALDTESPRPELTRFEMLDFDAY